MTLAVFNQLIPSTGVNPSAQYQIMQENYLSTFNILAIDHIGFNTTNGGYHTVIHQPPQGSNPGAIVGIGQTFTKTVSGDQQLFYESGGGVVTQLTGPSLASIGTNGFTWLPGPVMLQWGTVNPANGSGTITFAGGDLFE